MAKVTYKPKRAGFKQLFNSREMCELCTEHAYEIANRANDMYDADGYEVDDGRPGKFRAHAIVYTGDLHTMRSQRLHNTLQKSLD